jgi:hypothetical protein
VGNAPLGGRGPRAAKGAPPSRGRDAPTPLCIRQSKTQHTQLALAVLRDQAAAGQSQNPQKIYEIPTKTRGVRWLCVEIPVRSLSILEAPQPRYSAVAFTGNPRAAKPWVSYAPNRAQ